MSEKIDTDTTITEIEISQDQLETIQRILGSNVMRAIKKDRLLALTGLKHLLCCVCGNVSPQLYQVRYSDREGGAVIFEIYSSTHIETYTKNKHKTSEEIAESYGCQIGQVPPTIREPWD